MREFTITDLGPAAETAEHPWRYHVLIEKDGGMEGLPLWDLDRLFEYLRDYAGAEEFTVRVLIRSKREKL